MIEYVVYRDFYINSEPLYSFETYDKAEEYILLQNGGAYFIRKIYNKGNTYERLGMP